MRYIVVRPHRSEYPDPIRLVIGDVFVIGECYEGPESWDDWFFCTLPGHPGGWVPSQVIERQDDGMGRALEDYCARELDIDTGDILDGGRMLNGWIWCRRNADGESGWVPQDNLKPVSVG
ncbi:SH3 domain-containing protein [Corticimicrobacter populi]|uniref:Ligand-binding protein SH3 n=1 Tax=Corticimicrobacter populi TaxID=2175229 RepID=A0A2V1JZ35_9BURK|nr:SH3 domain-containing protein [Corticimicrobacter populi]PWF23046.1 ligand-binding protein SH3 [Corticimicrobacter populi]QDQ87606.1 ligand-binding protein SH3 [Alcaligenaceae bacterium SJ-26]